MLVPAVCHTMVVCKGNSCVQGRSQWLYCALPPLHLSFENTPPPVLTRVPPPPLPAPVRMLAVFTNLEKKLSPFLLCQVLNNLPVSARAFNKRGIGGWSSNVSRMNSFARMNSGTSSGAACIAGGGGGGATGIGFNRQRRFRGGDFNSGNTLAAGADLIVMCIDGYVIHAVTN